MTVPSGTGIDNAKATFRIEWPTPVSDWDMKVLRDDEVVASSRQGTTSFEEAVVADPSGSYVVRVINYAAVEPWSGTVAFQGPQPYQEAQQETWTLFCEQPEGTIRSARQVFVERGGRRSIDLRTDCRVRR